MDLRPLFTKDCSFFCYSPRFRAIEKPDFTLVLNIGSLVFLDITFDLQTSARMLNADISFPILTCMSRSDLPSLLMLFPRCAKSSTLSIYSPSSSIFSLFLVLTLITFALDLLILRPVCIEICSSLVSLDCMLWWLCERRAISSVKS